MPLAASASNPKQAVQAEQPHATIAWILDALLSGQALADGSHGFCVVAGSGAGKTTLMDCILGRKTTGLIRGEILVNGHPKEQATWSRVCG
jgi:ABC-type transport system involved in cytochrome bd biosynthesis fused ATPase/permease subunit